jgi:hypothetical protein
MTCQGCRGIICREVLATRPQQKPAPSDARQPGVPEAVEKQQTTVIPADETAQTSDVSPPD